jgi:hypothetical protein
MMKPKILREWKYEWENVSFNIFGSLDPYLTVTLKYNI